MVKQGVVHEPKQCNPCEQHPEHPPRVDVVEVVDGAQQGLALYRISRITCHIKGLSAVNLP